MSVLTLKLLNFKKEKTKEELAKAGNKEAFVELINENRLNLYKVAKGILREEKDIEDAIGNTVMKSFEKIGTLKNPEYFKTWLIRILINECNLIIRKNKKTICLEHREESYEDSYRDLDLIRAIDNLEKDLKEVIVLYYFQDMRSEEISKCLNINHNTVRTRLYRSKKKLYEMLMEE